jgi:hypothetical protein
MPNYNCSRCEYYDNLNGYFCRVCGHSLQFDHKSRQKILLGYMTDEKYCDTCGTLRPCGNCKPKIDRKF